MRDDLDAVRVPQAAHSGLSGGFPASAVPNYLSTIRDALAQHAADPCECGPDHGAPSCVACYDRAALELVGGLEAALGEARETLEHIHDWATLGHEGKRFPWIAYRTVAALRALLDVHSWPTAPVTQPSGSPCHCARLLPALKRWADARDACTGPILAGTPVDQVIATCDEATAACDALEALAREVTDG